MIALIIALCIFSFEVGTIAGIFISKKLLNKTSYPTKETKNSYRQSSDDFDTSLNERSTKGMDDTTKKVNSKQERAEKNYLDDLNFLFNFDGKEVKEDE